jgi:hypothetical protein
MRESEAPKLEIRRAATGARRLPKFTLSSQERAPGEAAGNLPLPMIARRLCPILCPPPNPTECARQEFVS